MAVGAVIVWTAQSDSAEPGDIDAAAVGDFCGLVDVRPLVQLTPVEEGREDRSSPEADPPRFGCEVKLLGHEEATRYLAVTLLVDVRVEADIGDAREAYAGAVDFEESEGLTVSGLETAADEAGFVVVVESPEVREYRAHVRDSNGVASVSLVITGDGLGAAEARDLLPAIAQGTLDVMGSE
ncbi:hypothetical protein LX16_5128 [Stackebrandtia albiflava]|uniref:Uncharacterized protein n=1 Tax=Stackebrandtia albiflava TaxID=406432 RepID=A0A562UPV5_9ACTN|nr:hypothetical protein LX16_5128 [Stackebrandtia albiflava]